MNIYKIKNNMWCLVNNKIVMVCLIAIIGVLTIYKQYLLSTIILFIYICLQSYIIFNYESERKQKEEYIKNLSIKMNPLKKTIFSMVHFPIIFLSRNGDVIWYNESISLQLESSNILGKNIKDVIKEINIKLVLDKKKLNYKNIYIGDKIYDIYINIMDDNELDENEKVIVLTLYDISDKVNLTNELNDTKESIILIEVDNLDDVIKTTEEDLRPQLIADIDRGINNYASTLGAMIKKYSSNKYVLVAKDIHIQDEMNKKFSILDLVREINSGNKLAVTLSMGVGIGGKTPAHNQEFATAAKELALSRGGDQCVVKSFEKVSFYGGKTKEVEKRTKVRARVIGHALLDLINESSNIFIMGHHNPDMDCLGAAIGMYSVINSLHKDCYVVLDEPYNAVSHMLEKLRSNGGYDNTFIGTNHIRNFKNEKSLLILVDVHNESYVLSMDVVKYFSRVVIIDHHRKTKDFIQETILSYVEPYASSTSELITELIQYMVEKPKLKEIEAVSLLAGICLDTKNFCFKTGVRTFEAAAFLRRLGADTVDVKKIFCEELDVYNTRSDIIRTAVVSNGIAIAKCPRNIASSVLTAQAADELLNITGIQASFVLMMMNEDTYISGRSLGDINVQVILETLGGGGHLTMAGAKIKDSNQEESEKLLNKAIEDYLGKGEK